ncbi:MAG: GDSL-type esterase/lipase family protein [Myxococcota bacterium]
MAIAAIAFAMTLGFFELLLRWQFGPPARFTYPQEYYQDDPEIGHALVPNQEAFTHHVPIRTNSHGLRDAEFAKQPPPGVSRVIAIGDSQTYGEGLPSEGTWPKQLEAMLNRDRVRRSQWQVVNAGLSASDTWQHAIILDRVLNWYDADVVVLAIYVNDVTARWMPGPASERTNSMQKRVGYLLKRSAVLSLARRAFLRSGHQDMELEILKGESEVPQIEAGWETMARSLDQMRALCRARGIELFAAILPRKDQVAGLTPERGYQDRVIRILDAVGIEHADLLVPMSEAYPTLGERLFIPWDGHNATEANTIVADQVEKLLRRASRGDHAHGATSRRGR